MAAKAAKTPLVAVSLGDPSGIGPEVLAAALSRPRVRRSLVPVAFGDERVWARACKAMGVSDRLARIGGLDEIRGPSLLPVTSLRAADARPGKPTLEGGRAQLAYLERAAEALEGGLCQALCTAPLSKAQVASTGLAFTGHTEYLAERFHARVVMMLAGPHLKVALHTTHLGIADVPGALSEDGIFEDLVIVSRELQEHWGLRRPRVAVCALNPHAGESGHFGDEETRIIAPAIARARARRLDASGPFAADGLFPRAVAGEFDAVLAMYHDQGLVPLKLLDFDRGVNVTLGLPVPRTSPDHGGAYDLAGKGRARPESMEAALLLAAAMATGKAGRS